MRVKSVTERYRAVNEGTMSKKEFVRQMRQQYPMHITQFNGFDDSVQILKNRGLLFETKKEVVEAHVYDERPALNYSLDALDRAIRIEIQALGLQQGENISAADFKKAEKKAKSNLEKNPTHYLDLMSGESKKVDKHDKMKETKRGATDADTFNAMIKATLKEGYTEEQIEAAVQRIKERKAGEHEDGTPKSNDEMGDDEREDFYNDLDSVEEVEKVDVVKEAGKTALIQTMNNAIAAIKGKYGEMPGIAGIIRDFLMTHLDDLADGADPLDEFENYVDANYDSLSEGEVEEKKGKDHDGDGDIDSDDYMAAKDKAIKKAIGKKVDEIGMFHDPKGYDSNASAEDKRALELVKALINKGVDKDNAIEKAAGKFGLRTAYLTRYVDAKMGKNEQLKEAVKSIIKKVLTEETINEAATGNLARYSEDYSDFEGMTQIINQLENLVTDVEGYYAKTSEKLQKIFDSIGNITNEEGLKVGGFIAPGIESAFKKDIQPVVRKGFMNAVQIPTVKAVSSADIDRMKGDQRMSEEEMEEKQTMFTPVMESKKK